MPFGKVQAIQSSFCYHVPYDPGSRLFSAALAGGSLLDVGIYNVAAAPIVFPEGAVSQFVCAFDGAADNALRIYGGWPDDLRRQLGVVYPFE